MNLRAVALAGLLLGAPSAAFPDSCSCASDGGASAVCIDGDAAGQDTAFALGRPVTLELRGSTNQQLADELSRLAGQRLAFLPAKPDGPVHLDVKDAPLWDVLEVLSRGGVVRVEGEDFSKLRAVRQALAGGEALSVCIKGAPAARVVSDLSGLSGQALRVTSGDEQAVVTLAAKEITPGGILSRVSAQTGARFAAQ